MRQSRAARAAGPPTKDGAHGVTRPTRATAGAPCGEHAKLRARLADAEATLRAIRTGSPREIPRLVAGGEVAEAISRGEVDTVMVAGKEGSQVFTLAGAEHAYRMLIESMNEGALTLTADKTILYANRCFARMVKCPLEQVLGSSFRRFLSDVDRATLRRLLKRPGKSGAKIQVVLKACDGSQMPVQVSVRPLAKDGFNRATIGMVVTDMTEVRRNEDLLRALTQRVVQVQEAERGRVALELHDNITQLICGVLVRSQVLADHISPRDGSSKGEAITLRTMLGHTAEEVERISRDLRPSVLNELGLVAVLRDTTKDFAKRTGISISLKLACVQLTARLPADTELTLYRILQEALKNAEKHARARHVTVCLRRQGDIVQLTINDDGNGFNPEHHPARRNGKGGLGLLGMRERAIYAGGVLHVKSAPGKGTTIRAEIPLANGRRGGGKPAGKLRVTGP